HDRHGEGLYLARSAAGRVDADVVGDAPPGAVQIALAGVRALSLREPEGCDHHLVDRRDRRGVADRWRSRYRRTAVVGLLLRPDRPAVGGPGRRRGTRLRSDRDRWSRRARRQSQHGGALMDPRKLRLGFLLATGAIMLAFVLPIATHAPALS